MKYSFSLESVNMLTSGPNFIYKQSKSFWVNYFKYISAAGFRSVELPFNLFSSDPMAFETGRCGIPLSANAINSKYGSAGDFLCFLNELGIDEISSIHVNANDAMLELVAAKLQPADYYRLFAEMLQDSLEHCKSLNCKSLIISPSPELGWLKTIMPDDLDGKFERCTAYILNSFCHTAASYEISVAVRAEFWSLYRGNAIMELLNEVPGLLICPDFAHMHIAGVSETEALAACAGKLLCPRLTDTSFTDEYNNFERINAEIPVDGPQKVFSDLGDGTVKLSECAQIIKDSGYDGYVVCEQRKTLDVYRGLLKLRWYLDHEISGRIG